MIIRTAFKIYPTYKEMTFRQEAKLAKVKIYAESSEKYITEGELLTTLNAITK